ncbi:hypothetical protein VXE41_14380 [Acinetobacter variabilis]
MLSHELKEIAERIEEQFTDLIFAEMDHFLESQGWNSKFGGFKQQVQQYKNQP